MAPRGTDQRFLEKLNRTWDGVESKYQSTRFQDGFIIQHYAADVQYSTKGWLDKNKDRKYPKKLYALEKIIHLSNILMIAFSSSQ